MSKCLICNLIIHLIFVIWILKFYNNYMGLVSALFFLASLYYLYFFVALGKTGSFFGFADLFLAALLIWVSSIKVDPEKLWFTIKGFGWGWKPETWQGWTVTLIATIMLVFGAMINFSQTHSGSDFLINYIPFLGIVVAVLISICFKTGEAPKWKWGKSSKMDKI
jgi:hypothetical protein